jgi:hypothetical protein
MEEACTIFISVTPSDEEVTVTHIKDLCDRIIAHNVFDSDEPTNVINEDNVVTWSLTVNADFVDENEIKEIISGEFEDNELIDVIFEYFDNDEIEHKLEFAVDNGIIFDDYEQHLSDEDE